MISNFLDWLFKCEEKCYKCSPLENSIMRILSPKTGLLIPEIQANMNYINTALVDDFEKILERLESFGMVRYKNGKWYKARLES